MQGVEHGTLADAKIIAEKVDTILDQKIANDPGFIRDVEEIQDVVEEQLML